jgi:cytoskeletal protein CcmA (bactofilin family)
MFGRRPQAPQNKKVDTIIGKDTIANGRMEIRGSVRLDGCFDGNIHADGDVAIGDSAKLKATIHAVNITIAGEVEGDIYASGRLEIASTGRLYGEVKAGALCVEDGAIFRGSCELKAGALCVEDGAIFRGSCEMLNACSGSAGGVSAPMPY